MNNIIEEYCTEHPFVNTDEWYNGLKCFANEMKEGIVRNIEEFDELHHLK